MLGWTALTFDIHDIYNEYCKLMQIEEKQERYGIGIKTGIFMW